MFASILIYSSYLHVHQAHLKIWITKHLLVYSFSCELYYLRYSWRKNSNNVPFEHRAALFSHVFHLLVVLYQEESVVYNKEYFASTFEGFHFFKSCIRFCVMELEVLFVRIRRLLVEDAGALSDEYIFKVHQDTEKELDERFYKLGEDFMDLLRKDLAQAKQSITHFIGRFKTLNKGNSHTLSLKDFLRRAPVAHWLASFWNKIKSFFKT